MATPRRAMRIYCIGRGAALATTTTAVTAATTRTTGYGGRTASTASAMNAAARRPDPITSSPAAVFIAEGFVETPDIADTDGITVVTNSLNGTSRDTGTHDQAEGSEFPSS
jgi:hypothetical protein